MTSTDQSAEAAVDYREATREVRHSGHTFHVLVVIGTECPVTARVNLVEWPLIDLEDDCHPVVWPVVLVGIEPLKRQGKQEMVSSSKYSRLLIGWDFMTLLLIGYYHDFRFFYYFKMAKYIRKYIGKLESWDADWKVSWVMYQIWISHKSIIHLNKCLIHLQIRGRGDAIIIYYLRVRSQI